MAVATVLSAKAEYHEDIMDLMTEQPRKAVRLAALSYSCSGVDAAS